MTNPQPRGLTREALRIMNDNALRPVTYRLDPEFLEDVDGRPLAVGQPETGTAILARPVISKAEAERLNVTPEEFPNVTIV